MGVPWGVFGALLPAFGFGCNTGRPGLGCSFGNGGIESDCTVGFGTNRGIEAGVFCDGGK